MLKTRFGIEIEFTGITRSKAAKIATEFLNGTVTAIYDHYDTQRITASDERIWEFKSDASIRTEKKVDGQTVSASKEYSVELVSPILTYEADIIALQELIRLLRKAGAFTNAKCGIHIHLDGQNHTPRSIRNFINIIASKNDLFYKALDIEPERMSYCKKMDTALVEKMNRKKSATMEQLQEIWYEGYHESQSIHYHSSRYHFLYA